MAADELVAFRERWKEELENKKEERPLVPGQPGRRDSKNRYFEDFCQNTNARDRREASSPSKSEGSSCIGDDGGTKGVRQSEDQPQYVSIASGLLDGRTSPLLDRLQEERTRRKRQHQSSESMQHPLKKTNNKGGEKLVDQLIRDLVRKDSDHDGDRDDDSDNN